MTTLVWTCADKCVKRCTVRFNLGNKMSALEDIKKCRQLFVAGDAELANLDVQLFELSAKKWTFDVQVDMDHRDKFTVKVWEDSQRPFGSEMTFHFNRHRLRRVENTLYPDKDVQEVLDVLYTWLDK